MHTSLRVTVTGDFMVSSDVTEYQFGPKLKRILSDSDINITNVEAPVKTKEARPIKKSGPNLCIDPEAPGFLEKEGFNVVTLANNHIIDYGTESAQKTIESFSPDTSILGVGTFNNAYEPKFLRIGNVTIGFLAFSQYEFGVHAEKSYDDGKIGTAWMLHPMVDLSILSAKKKCDWLICLPHAGLEYFMLPLPELRTLYRHYIDMGADAIVASHPHVPQPWEIYKGKPIAYSLGNFCFATNNKTTYWYDGLIAQLDMSDTEILMSIKTLHFDIGKKCIELSEDKKLDADLSMRKQELENEAIYIERINAQCISMIPHYLMLNEMGGYYKLTIKKALGYIKRKILRRENMPNSAHFINSMRCETHRWIQSRIYELTNTH